MDLSDSQGSVDNDILNSGHSVPIRRSNRNMTYEEQIQRSHREVLGEKELASIRDSILEGTKKYQEKPKKTKNAFIVKPYSKSMYTCVCLFSHFYYYFTDNGLPKCGFQ